MTVDLTIGGMTCLDCARRVTRALRSVDGVVQAHVDYRAGRGHVAFAPGVVSTSKLSSALAAAVVQVGYSAEPLADPPQLFGSVPAARSASDVAAPCCASASVGVVAPSLLSAGVPDTGRSDTAFFAGEPPTDRVPRDASLSRSKRNGAGRRADFDLFIIGTGGAGVAAAIQAASMGAKVAIAEGATLGGTCVNVGCIPSKTLMEAAAHVHAARRGFPGVAPYEPSVDWGEVVRRKDALVNELRDAKYADVLAGYPGVTRLEGQARLLSASDGLVRIRVGEGAGTCEHTACKAVVATGAVATLPSITGIETVEVLTSTTAMDLHVLPESLIVLGGGQVGVELGQMFARFGVKVVIVQRASQLLPGEDPEIAAVLREALAAEGIEVHTGTAAVRVEHVGTEVVVHVRNGSVDGQLRAARVLVAAGRRPNTRDLGLEDIGVALTPSGYIQTDAALRTANPDVYAAGDVTGGPGYVYVAAAGGRVAAENAIMALHGAGASSDAPRELDLSVVPSVTFTVPQVASVGLTEAAARAAGHHIDVSVLDMAHVPRALVSYDRRGLLKLVSESGSGRILGVQAVAPNAGEFMGEATLAVRFGLTVRDLSGTLHPYLTWVESLKLAAQGGSAGVEKLSCCA